MMARTKSSPRRNLGARAAAQNIPNHRALALIGQTVSLLGRSKTIRHGVVAGVVNETGRPKLVVDRVEYDLSQVLSVTPPSFN